MFCLISSCLFAHLYNTSISCPNELGRHRYVDSWKRHQALWKTEKASVMDKFKMKHPTNTDFEEKLAKYAKLADDVWRQASRSACTMARLKEILNMYGCALRVHTLQLSMSPARPHILLFVKSTHCASLTESQRHMHQLYES